MPGRITAIVVTGAGGAHLDAYFAALAEIDAVDRVAVADASGESQAVAERALGKKLVRFDRDLTKALAAEKPSFAIVSVEAVLAPPLIREVLQAGCHVLAEKPSCVRVANFAELVTLADGKHRHLMLALANRMRPRVAHARMLIQTGAIGALYGAELHIIADQTRLHSPAYHQSWFADKSRAGGGHLAWLGIHWLDLVMFLTGAKITETAAFIGNVGQQPISVEDSAAAILRFDCGFFGTITSGYYLDRGYHSYIKIWGSHGWLQMEPHGDVQLQWYSTKDTPPQIKQFEGPPEMPSYTPFVRACVASAVDPMIPPPITGAEGLAALKAVFSCYASAESRRVEPTA
ncbi:MAG: Gfo/Idh/MocA family oxidoreductase [Planctomycetes bacterium]|nr:Gfo/Idh/MocA family oxidoreductase [Planctomycetota bacterium]